MVLGRSGFDMGRARRYGKGRRQGRGGCPGNAQPGSVFRGRRSAGAPRLIEITGTLTATPAALVGTMFGLDPQLWASKKQRSPRAQGVAIGLGGDQRLDDGLCRCGDGVGGDRGVYYGWALDKKELFKSKM